MISSRNLTLNFGLRMGLFVCVFLVCFIICSIVTGFIVYKWGDSTPAMRIATVIQDLIVWIIPAIVISMLITRVPASFLSVDRFPGLPLVILTLMALVFSIPAMNCIVLWNDSMSLPDSLQPLEEWMRSAEDNAETGIKILMGDSSVGSIVMSILIIGVLTGFGEELFFRGALQGLLHTRPMNPHIAIWITAVVFSAVHLQFFGFFPRVLLGVFFGYLVWWSGSLWLPVIAHAFNNSLVAVSMWIVERGVIDTDMNEVGTEPTTASVSLAVASVAATMMTIIMIYREAKRINQTSSYEK